MNPKSLRLNKEEESLLKILPEGPFMSRDVSKLYGNKKTPYILMSLEYKGRITQDGMTGRLNRYKQWKRIPL